VETALYGAPRYLIWREEDEDGMDMLSISRGNREGANGELLHVMAK
jgi:hypothetical protein